MGFVYFPMSTRNVKLVNLTGHSMSFVNDLSGDSVRLDANGKARVDSRVEIDEQVIVDGVLIPILRVDEARVVGLPEPRDGVLYVVSGIVASHIRREDVVAPSRVERKRNGRVMSARALIRIEKGET